MIPHDKLDQIVARLEFLEARLNAGVAPAELATLSREYAGLKPVVEEIGRYRALLSERAETERLRQKVQPVVAKFSQEIGVDLMQQVNAELARLRGAK